MYRKLKRLLRNHTNNSMLISNHRSYSFRKYVREKKPPKVDDDTFYKKVEKFFNEKNERPRAINPSIDRSILIAERIIPDEYKLLTNEDVKKMAEDLKSNQINDDIPYAHLRSRMINLIYNNIYVFMVENSTFNFVIKAFDWADEEQLKKLCEKFKENFYEIAINSTGTYAISLLIRKINSESLLKKTIYECFEENMEELFANFFGVKSLEHYVNKFGFKESHFIFDYLTIRFGLKNQSSIHWKYMMFKLIQTSYSEIDIIFEFFEKNFIEILYIKNGYALIQCFWKYATESHKDVLLEKIRGDFFELSKNLISSWTVKMFLEMSNYKWQKIISDELNSKLDELTIEERTYPAFTSTILEYFRTE